MNITNTFKFGALAHGSLALVYLIKTFTIKNIFTIAYFLGHLSIFIAMLIRVNPKERGEKHTEILGYIGHTSLLIYFINILFNNSANFRITMYNPILLDILCVIGQIGMITVYKDEYIYANKEIPQKTQLKNMSIFIILSLFYHIKAYNSIQTSYIFCIPLFLVSMLYFQFFINQFKEYRSHKSTKKSTL